MTSLPCSRRLRMLQVVMLVTLMAHSVAAHAQRPLRGRADRNGDRTVIAVGSAQRYAVVRAPREAPRAGGKRPLVIVLHGGGGNAANAEQMTGFSALVEREGIVVAYAEGSGRGRARLLTWNATHCCGNAMTSDIDDVRFLDALMDTLIARYAVDDRRIYITGMSNGAMMTHQAGIALSHRVAAIAPVVGALFGDEPRPANAVSAIIFNGMRDESVPFAGGPSGGVARRSWDGTPVRPAQAQGSFWAIANGCNDRPMVDTAGTVIHMVYRCPPGRAVELYALTDGGHAWPGGRAGSRRGDRPATSINATEVMWAFFKAHARN